MKIVYGAILRNTDGMAQGLISGFGAGTASRLQWVENEPQAFHRLCRVEVHLTLLKNQGATRIISLHNTLDEMSL